jgi:hypothetical protein
MLDPDLRRLVNEKRYQTARGCGVGLHQEENQKRAEKVEQ